MKKVISISLLLVILFFIFQWGITFFKKGHEVTYDVYQNDKKFMVTEKYQMEEGNYYSFIIETDEGTFSYIHENDLNKQNKVIDTVIYSSSDNDMCIYPVLSNEKGLYIQCISDGKLYSSSSYPNQDFVNSFEDSLVESGYPFIVAGTAKTEKLDSSTIQVDNLLSTDIITLWTYKGIQTISTAENYSVITLAFDKYENKHGYLVGKYYIIPNYQSSRLLEFSSINIINVETNKTSKLELGYTLSSSTYINGVLDGKLYYTDPSNLIQLELNPDNKKVRLIGSADIGGQLYNGSWESVNIYDFVNDEITFGEVIPNEITEKYSYVNITENEYGYYFYNNSGEVYFVSKNYQDAAVLLFKAAGINNLVAAGNNLYYVVDNTLYYFDYTTRLIPVLTNNELRYNTHNRIDVYRKS